MLMKTGQLVFLFLFSPSLARLVTKQQINLSRVQRIQDGLEEV